MILDRVRLKTLFDLPGEVNEKNPASAARDAATTEIQIGIDKWKIP